MTGIDPERVLHGMEYDNAHDYPDWLQDYDYIDTDLPKDPETPHEARDNIDKLVSDLKAVLEDYERDYCKRPAPKVLDADGVEIKAWQEVYGTGREQHRYIVLMPHDECNGAIFTVKCRDLDDEGVVCHCAPSQLTHEKPVFDAEGVRICKGDTVWHVRTGQKATVTTVYKDDKTCVEVEIAGHFMDYEPSDLTHREPDSLEKLRDEINVTSANDVNVDLLKDWRDRLTALIERGA